MSIWEAINSSFTLFGAHIKWTDLVGTLFALITVPLALKRLLIAWPVQILGSVFLFAAYLSAQLGGGAARQLVIIATASWGWLMWKRTKKDTGDISVRWAQPAERVILGAAMVLGTVAVGAILHWLNISFYPGAPWHLVLADAWIFVGTVVAMYGQARRLVEFWFVWILVDLVGVPLAFHSQLYFQAVAYLIFFVMVIWGIFDWSRRSQRTTVTG